MPKSNNSLCLLVSDEQIFLYFNQSDTRLPMATFFVQMRWNEQSS